MMLAPTRLLLVEVPDKSDNRTSGFGGGRTFPVTALIRTYVELELAVGREFSQMALRPQTR